MCVLACCNADERSDRRNAARYLDTHVLPGPRDLLSAPVARRGSLIFCCGNRLMRNNEFIDTLWPDFKQGGVSVNLLRRLRNRDRALALLSPDRTTKGNPL